MNFNIKDIHHIELTVRDLNISRNFYESVLDFKCVAKYDDFNMLTRGNFYLGLTTHRNVEKSTFDEKVTGLDHISFGVSSNHDLDSALSFFNKNDISHGEIEKLSNGILVLAFRDPDNIQLELCFKDNG